MLREYRVQHASTDGILLQLPGNAGFGRVTKATLGNDELAGRLLKLLAGREVLRAAPQRKRDAEGYRVMSLQLGSVWSDVLLLPAPVRSLLQVLFRKHVGVAIGSVTRGTVIKSSNRGYLLTLVNGVVAAATVETRGAAIAADPSKKKRPREEDEDDAHATEMTPVSEGASALVRVLNYDVSSGVVNVSINPSVVEAAPSLEEPGTLAVAFSQFSAGQSVEARVLLSVTDDQCSVVEIFTNEERTVSVLGYFLRLVNRGTSDKASLHAVGERITATVEFVPNTLELQSILPVLVLSDRTKDVYLSLPETRRAVANTPALGFFPWRDTSEGGAAGGARWNEEDFFLFDDNDAAAGKHGHSEELGGASYKSQMRKRRLEETIDSFERNADQQIPASPEEFQRALLGSPNSSYLWTQYMAYHTSLQQYEQARQVAERALAKIGVRESKELLNVWVAYMNLENIHGTPESLNNIFKRALQRSDDTLVVHERLADVLKMSRKHAQLLQLCRTMVSKYRSERRVWERLGVTLVDSDKRDQLKRVIKEMSDSLKRDDQCLVVTHIAIHEYKRGGRVESGRALFEGLLTKLPRKSDVWSAYIDQEMSLLTHNLPMASVVGVRTLFERAVAMNFSTKVMQQFLTRFSAFEKRYGSPDDVERVKAKAREYVETKIAAQALH